MRSTADRASIPCSTPRRTCGATSHRAIPVVRGVVVALVIVGLAITPRAIATPRNAPASCGDVWSDDGSAIAAPDPARDGAEDAGAPLEPTEHESEARS